MSNLLPNDERKLAQISCLVMEDAFRSVGTGPGTLIATDKRLVYYTNSKMLGEHSLEFFYENLKPIQLEKQKGFLGLFPSQGGTFYYEGTRYKITHVLASDQAFKKLIDLVQEHIEKNNY